MDGRRQTVCVVGGGIAGLSAAQLLTSLGFSVDVIEREEVCGGRANVLRDGEHCPRFFLDDYHTLDRLLAAVPGHSSASVLADMVPVVRLSKDQQGQWKRLDHLYEGFARSISLRGRLHQVRQSRSRREAFLIAQQTSTTTTVFGSRKNFSWRSSLRVARSLLASRSGRVLPGNTLTYLVDPWVAHLASKGVEVRTGAKVEQIRPMPNKVEAVIDGVACSYDGMILAAYQSDASQLIEASGMTSPYPSWQHTHLKVFTIAIESATFAPNADATVRYHEGVTILCQPRATRCVALCMTTTSSSEEDVLRVVGAGLDIPSGSLRVTGVRDNLLPHEAVYIGDYCARAAAVPVLGSRVVLAGSWIENSYAVDSAEAAARSAEDAVKILSHVLAEG